MMPRRRRRRPTSASAARTSSPRASAASRAQQAWTGGARRRAARASLIYGGWRGDGARARRAGAAGRRASSVRGNERLSTGEVLALVDGLARAEHPDRAARRLAAAAAGVAVGRGARRFAACCRRRVDIAIHERRPMGIGRLARALYLVDAQRRDHRRIRPELRRSRPADHRRARRAPPATARVRSTSRAPSLRRA